MTASIINLPVNDDLKNLNVTGFTKENHTFQLTFNNEKVLIFDIHSKAILKTIENLKVAAKVEKLDNITINKIAVILLNEQNGYIEFLQDGNGTCNTDYSGSYGNTQEIEKTGCQQQVIARTLIDNSKDLDPYIRDRDYAEFVIKTVKKTVKQEDLLVRILVYVGLTVYSYNPLCIGIRAPTSEGKTYAVIQSILKFFPKKDLWLIGSMSPKALIRQHGILVDKENKPLGDKEKELKKQIKQCGNSKNLASQKVELEDELDKLYQGAKWLINLQGKILIFLEAPHPEVWNIIKPILSHDTWEIEHPYVDADLKTKNVVTRGWPVCIFCSAKDESKWDIWPEIQSRFLITSPNMSPEKYLESNRLTFQKLGLPNFVQQQLIVSDYEVELARKCILQLKHRINSLCPIRYVSNEFKPLNPVWIPYHQYLGESLPSNKGPTMRTASHVGALLEIIVLAKSDLMVDFGIEKQVIARSEDLVETLRITNDITSSSYSGVPSHKVKFLKEIFIPLIGSKTEPDSKNDKEEKIIAVTTKELCDFYKKTTGKGIATDNLKKNYLDELLVNDVIGKAESEIDKRQYIYYALIEADEDEESSKENQAAKITKLSNGDIFDNFLHVPRLKLSRDYKEVPEDWLILQILSLAKYRMDLHRSEGCIADFLNQSEELRFLDKDGNRLSIRQFILKYESNPAIYIRYIFKSDFYNFHTKHFNMDRSFCIINQERYKELSNNSQFDNFVISSDKGQFMHVAEKAS
jgi:hypothetical protein